MPELPQKKVGIISCSGEELAEGTVTRLAALKVLEKLRPHDTVTICLPLFLAGGEGDRAFARFYPTIAIDGCEKRCAYRGTEMYSNKPAVSIVVTDLVVQQNLVSPQGKRKLDEAGMQVVDVIAQQVSDQVDRLLGLGWSRREGAFLQPETDAEPEKDASATCSCGSGVPVQKIHFDGQEMTLVALPVIFHNSLEQDKQPSDLIISEMMGMLKIYNRIDLSKEPAIRQVVLREYQAYWQEHKAIHE